MLWVKTGVNYRVQLVHLSNKCPSKSNGKFISSSHKIVVAASILGDTVANKLLFFANDMTR